MNIDTSKEWWEIPDNLDLTNFDLEWMPDPYDPPYIHQFGTQWRKTDGPRYVIEGATQIKYQDCQQAVRLPTKENWVIPPNLDVSNFDFSWCPDSTEPPVIYQFGTQWQKTGGPKYMTPGARKLQYLDFQRAIKLPEMSKWYVPSNAKIIDFDFSWHPDANEVMTNYVFGDERSQCIVYTNTGYPKYQFMTNQIPKIDWIPLDLFYLSNGEPFERLHYERICELSGRSVKWINGIDGRELAIKEAAKQSSSDYFILFPAKVWAYPDFIWDFQPPVYYIDQHYIFYAKNTVNDLVYGHQAAICYNKKLVLSTNKWGLDFTMSAAHTVIPILCGEARYNQNAHITWRTAFREVIKLKSDLTTENQERLNTWLTVAHGDWSEWSIRGAQDGIEYWNSVNGDMSELMKTFDWKWLKTFWENKNYG